MNQIFSNCLRVLVILLFSISCNAQKFEWVKLIGGNNGQYSSSMAVDSLGNQYATFVFDTEVKFDTFASNPSKKETGLVLKQDRNRKLIWFKLLCSIGGGIANPLSAIFNSKGNLIVIVETQGDLKVGEDTIKRKSNSNHVLFIIEFSTSGKIVDSYQIVEKNWAIEGSDAITFDKNDNLYLALQCTGNVKVYDSGGVNTIGSAGMSTQSLKFSNSGRKFEWASSLPGPSFLLINSLKVDIKGNLYATASLQGSYSFSFKGQTINTAKLIKGYIFIWDKNGKEKNWFSMQADNSVFSDVAVYDSNSVFISGIYQGDSAIFDTIQQKNRRYGCYRFFAMYNSKGNVKWVNIEDTTYAGAFNNIQNKSCGITNYKDSFFYVSFYMPDHYTKPIIFDGQKYLPNPIGYGINMKVDEKGNILWGFRTLFPFASMGTDDENNLYFQGYGGGDTLRFGTIKYSPDGADAYIGKTFDYSIYRGNVKSGPYCAGDSLFIPFTKTGDFADTNIFFAEISDEFGNFTGKERLIGSIKSKNDGTIRGLLPMVKVASSGKYRIRIRSTSPQAQSFYKKDTLRLLIYSRDKANPGPPEWICRGDSIKLNTYGGTKWKWSPKYRMDDPNLQQPLVWPIKDTTYKIIIADSSGCGAPDTAYKKIFIRQSLKAVLAFTDTGLCKNITLKIPVHFIGGDSNYHWKSFNVVSPKSWSIINQGKLKQDDTLFYFTNLDSAKTSEKLALTLWDECTSKHDTVFVNINLRKPEFMASKFKDTLVCYGVPLSWTATTKAAVGTYHWQWKDLLSNTVLSTYDYLKLKPAQIQKVRLSLITLCNEDASVFIVNIKPPLKTKIFSGSKIFSDTTLCYDQSLKLYALGKGGDTSQYKFKWTLNGTIISTADTLAFKPNSTSILKLILTDNCTIGDDSISKIITVIPAPKADFSYGNTCNINPIQFIFKGTKPGYPITTNFKWDFAGIANSFAQDPFQLISTTGKKKIGLLVTSSNGCMDTISKEIDVRPQAKADFTANDVCENDSVVFINKSKDASGYNWKFGDGKNSAIENPNHKYSITTSTTFNVTLVAVVTGGCSDSFVKAVTINENPKSNFTYFQTANGKVDFKADQTIATNYRWLFGNGDSAKVNNPIYSYLYKKSSNYTICLKLTNTAGCQSETCKQISITGGVSILSKLSGFKLYPNPNTGNFIIEIENPANGTSIEVLDLLGKVVKNIETSPNKSFYSVDLTVANGIYLVSVKNNGLVYNQKVIIGQ